MASHILMPALSPTMTHGTLARWLKKEGDAVQAGEVIAEIETDKATMEMEAAEDGILGPVLIADNTADIAVNTPLAVLLEEGETAAQAEARLGVSPQQMAPASAGSGSASPEKPSAPGSRTASQAERETTLPGEKDWGETREITVREALRDAMAAEMRRDKDVFLLGEEVAEYQGAYKISQGLLEEFGPRRVYDMPISEHGFTGMAVGAALTGLRPIVEFMTMNFSMQAIDHIINSAAKTRYMSGGQMACPIVFRGPNGAAARVGAQHSQCYASWYAHVPGLKVVAPWSAADAKGLLRAAIRDPNPVVVLENEILYGQRFPCPVDEEFILPIGKAKIEREGSDVTLVAFSIMVGVALEAAELLAQEGISAEVINLRTLRPLDRETILNSIRKTSRVVSVEEGWPVAGIGAEICTLAVEEAFDWLDAPPARVAGLDIPLPYAANLEKLALPKPQWVVDAVRKQFRD
ncbi:pyruvate dehydrogenase complex E1 component subunit beta [Oecophyllibacter saccharovorans]|uniref:pyruvate dehydrogenase complex E1 component subunit beta n=1 Tax=Oecophyllibacter saccharovorans TaxID=2558360 RepID=UPI0011672F31|nr:pyruvate dehydrogenase complex E1 component subunit beta [Oecophyllibacter saccharovorans]TPW34624.1 pyruvate dehydrogenase complex E1 component subunit beta [Oecophyllibacter saccharovorans]